MSLTDAAKNRLEQFDIDQRQAEMDETQRFAVLSDDELAPEALEYAKRISASFGNEPRPLSDVFRTQFVNFPLFQGTMGLYMFLLTKGTLSDRDREIGILRILWLCGSPAPYAPHVDEALKVMSAEEIKRTQIGSSADGWSDHERAVLKGVEELYDRQAVSDETFAALAKTWTPAQLMEFPALVGCYFMSAVVHNMTRTKRVEGNKGFYQAG